VTVCQFPRNDLVVLLDIGAPLFHINNKLNK